MTDRPPLPHRRTHTMRRLGLLLTVFLVVASCATAQQRGQGLVGLAIDGMGGVQSPAAGKNPAGKGPVRKGEPEQSRVPGGEPVFPGESTFSSATDVTAGATRI